MKKLLLLLSLFISPCLIQANTQIPSSEVSVVASGFNKNLNSTDTNVQTALGTIDQMTSGSITAIGSPISGGTANRVLYNDNSGNLTDTTISMDSSNIYYTPGAVEYTLDSYPT